VLQDVVNVEDTGVDGSTSIGIILKPILNWGERVWTGFCWLRMGSIDVIL
jgi:hypothetical protein